jgi:UDP-N-acetylmuramate dehydrogenase
MGNGSNVFASDLGYRGAIIQISKKMNHAYVDGNIVTAEAGISLAKLANIILDQNLTGFEFASGIPGTLGGAVFMNAGAYGGEMKNVLESVKVIDEKGTIKTVSVDDLDLGYRSSIVQKNDWVVIEATMKFARYCSISFLLRGRTICFLA